MVISFNRAPTSCLRFVQPCTCLCHLLYMQLRSFCLNLFQCVSSVEQIGVRMVACGWLLIRSLIYSPVHDRRIVLAAPIIVNVQATGPICEPCLMKPTYRGSICAIHGADVRSCHVQFKLMNYSVFKWQAAATTGLLYSLILTVVFLYGIGWLCISRQLQFKVFGNSLLPRLFLQLHAFAIHLYIIQTYIKSRFVVDQMNLINYAVYSM